MLSPTPVAIKKHGRQALSIVWKDGHASRYDFRYLRQKCPCAACVDELTGRPLLDPDQVPLDLTGGAITPVGQYGLSIAFSDPHASGIYHFDLLRAICPCERCKEEETHGTHRRNSD